MTTDADYYHRGEAGNYDGLITAQPDLLPVIRQIAEVSGKVVADLGAGTGRLTLQVLPAARRVTAVDASEQMLAVLQEKAGEQPPGKLTLQAADYGNTGIESSSCHLILSGWALCYGVSPSQEGWEERLQAIWNEICRIGRPGADVILFENYGTAVEEPSPPSFLLPYFSALESVYGFQRTVISTDYSFGDVAEAAARTEAFFGEETAQLVRSNGWSIVPEFAGVWHRRLEG